MCVRAEGAELFGPDLDLRRPEVTTWKIPGAVIIDAKSVYDAFYKGEGAFSAFSLKEKHAALDLMAITENLGKQRRPRPWVASDAQLADGLTKSAAADTLLHFLQRGQLSRSSLQPSAKKQKALLSLDKPVVPESDLTWQLLISGQDSHTYTENLWGMSVFLIQPCEHCASYVGTSPISDSSCFAVPARI